MTLLEEIKAKCSPELLAARDVAAITADVNLGRTRITSRLGGIGLVLETLGPIDGAALLDQLELLAPTNSAVKWAFVLINRGELDFGSYATRTMIDLLIPGLAGAALKAVAEMPDPVSQDAVTRACYDDNGKERIA